MKSIVIFFLLLFTTLYSKEYKYTNALINEESPYLQQHAHNPVNWMPWGKKAFEKAKKENKLIFLSIGYSTCHWCHVMERESFENLKLAKVLNKNYISIKVDREEHPQIDSYYQQVHSLITHRAGGWPLTIILTPDKKPFFAGTYIPREGSYRQMGLLELLSKIAKVWHSEPKKIESLADRIDRALKDIRNRESIRGNIRNIDNKFTEKFVTELYKSFDKVNGGWGRYPKFPRAQTIITLLNIYEITKDKRALDMSLKSLDSMAKGGVFDQIEGGFFRYSTDSKWHIPHFEKMLYTNAELIEAYTLAWKITHKKLYKNIVRRTIDDMLKYYRDSSGLFYGASDADSLNPESKEKEEGFYFTYDYSQSVEKLKKMGLKNVDERLKSYAITPSGNMEDFHSNAYLKNRGKRDIELEKALVKLRKERKYPFIDHKMLTSWNALMIHALYKASIIDDRYGKIAKETLDSLLSNLLVNGKLYHQKLPAKRLDVLGIFEDYSFLTMALLDGYENSFDKRYLNIANNLIDSAKSKFYKNGIFYDDLGELGNPLDMSGSSYRSSLAVWVDNLLRFGILKENPKYKAEAEDILEKQGAFAYAYPSSAPMAVLDILADKYGYILIKANDIFKLKKMVERDISYPFIMFDISKEKFYQACKIDKCFLYEKDMDIFLRKLKNRI